MAPSSFNFPQQAPTQLKPNSTSQSLKDSAFCRKPRIRFNSKTQKQLGCGHSRVCNLDERTLCVSGEPFAGDASLKIDTACLVGKDASLPSCETQCSSKKSDHFSLPDTLTSFAKPCLSLDKGSCKLKILLASSSILPAGFLQIRREINAIWIG